MRSLKTGLKASLEGWRRIAFLGIGSELRGDDAAGPKVLERLDASLGGRDDIAFFHGGSAPENLTGAIRDYNPTHLVVIDAADLGKKPGSVRIIGESEIGGASFSTHSLPIPIILGYLRSTVKAREIVIGIQPGSLEFDSPVTAPVAAAVASLADDIIRAVETTRA
ncbi:MAG TPA: hydrogenase maturation peptidase HycI [Spirochaetota bacterium]|nr:hydrogenase maturation peptidase HycI [Spirochaetota bacterium]